MPVSKGAVVAIGAVGGIATVVGVGLALEKKASAAAGPGELALTGASGVTGAPGRPVSATLTFRATGGATDAQAVPVGITASQGGTTTQTIATAQVPALAAGGTAQVQVTSEGPMGPFQFGSVQVVFALASGSTISGTFQVQALPAAFSFVAGSLSISSPVQVGQYATASMQVTNTGQTAGTPSVSGVTDLGSTEEGTWVQTSSPSIAPGATATVTMRTSGALNSQFGGQTLTAVFAVA